MQYGCCSKIANQTDPKEIENRTKPKFIGSLECVLVTFWKALNVF